MCQPGKKPKKEHTMTKIFKSCELCNFPQAETVLSSFLVNTSKLKTNRILFGKTTCLQRKTEFVKINTQETVKIKKGRENNNNNN